MMQTQQQSVVAGNKENSKKTPNEVLTAASGAGGNTTTSGLKMHQLKGREFGREITNAASASTNATGKAGQANHSMNVELKHSHNIASIGQSSSIIG
jgi:hypothetical protein